MRPVREREVTVYGTTWCPHSHRAKAFLESRGVPYREVDIERDTVAAKQVEEWSEGYRSVPTIVARLIVTEPSGVDLERILLKSQARLMDCTAYITAWCPDCHQALAWLRARNFSCTTIDIDTDPEAAKRVQIWNKGFRSVPTLELTLLLTEPSMAQLESVLGLGE